MSKRSPGLPIPSDWNGSDWTRFSICWPNSLEWRAILAGFLTTPMLGRTWDADTGTITDVQQIGRQIFDSNLDWRYCIMSSCDENGLDRLIAAISANSGCCGGQTIGGGPGPIVEPPPTVVPGGTGVVPDGFPEGWDYEGDYLPYRCAAANKIVDDLILTVANMSSLGGILAGISSAALFAFINTSLLSGLLVGVMAIGFSAATAAAIIITALIAILAVGTGQFAYFVTLSEALADIKQELVCDLFAATSVAGARAATEENIDNAIGTLTGIDEAASDAMNSLVKAMVGNAVYNLLVEYDASIVGYEGTEPCDTCQGDCPRYNVSLGEYLGLNTVAAEASGNQSYVYVVIDAESIFPSVYCSDHSPDLLDIDITDVAPAYTDAFNWHITLRGGTEVVNANYNQGQKPAVFPVTGDIDTVEIRTVNGINADFKVVFDWDE